jgi:cytochrome c-type biogenesis protein CcmH
VLDFLVARYGEFVLLKPRFERQTLLLWLVTPLAFVGGGIALWLQLRRRSRNATDAPAPLTPEEETRLAALMGEASKSEESG